MPYLPKEKRHFILAETSVWMYMVKNIFDAALTCHDICWALIYGFEKLWRFKVVSHSPNADEQNQRVIPTMCHILKQKTPEKIQNFIKCLIFSDEIFCGTTNMKHKTVQSLRGSEKSC